MDVQNVLKGVVPAEKIALPGTEQYEQSNDAYFTRFESAIKPAAIVQPTSAEEVSALIKALHPKLMKQEISLAIKGTGHTSFAGSANIQDGITVELRGLKGIHLADDKTHVTIGVGETWGSVYDELEKKGLTTAGGRVGRVGVGGLLLGGGLSFFSTRRGFACDTVIDFEVVLASGEIVHANTHENADLFVALKGGLNNFGIVAAVKMETIKSQDMWGGVAVYGHETFGQLLEATSDFVKDELDEDTHLMVSAGYVGAYQMNVASCCMYHTKGVENPPTLQRFTALPMNEEHSSLRREAGQVKFCDQLSSFTLDGSRSLYATITIKPDVALMKKIHEIWLDTQAPVKSAEGIQLSLGYFPLTKDLLENSNLSGGNAMNIDPNDGPLMIVFLYNNWASEDDDERVHDFIRRTLTRFREAASEKALLHRYIFTNYAYQTEDVLAGYGEESSRKMKEVSEKYDPEGIFQKAVPGGFKLFKA